MKAEQIGPEPPAQRLRRVWLRFGLCCIFFPNGGSHLIDQFGRNIRIPVCRASVFATLAQHIINGFASRDEVAIDAYISTIHNLHSITSGG
jgi:hypothetical protein